MCISFQIPIFCFKFISKSLSISDCMIVYFLREIHQKEMLPKPPRVPASRHVNPHPASALMFNTSRNVAVVSFLFPSGPYKPLRMEVPKNAT